MYEQRFVFAPSGNVLRIVDWVTKAEILDIKTVQVVVNGAVQKVKVKQDGYIIGEFTEGDEIVISHPLYKKECLTYERVPSPFYYTVALLPNAVHPHLQVHSSLSSNVAMDLLVERRWLERTRHNECGCTTIYTLQANYFSIGEYWEIDQHHYRIIDININRRSFTAVPELPQTAVASVLFTGVKGQYVLPAPYVPHYRIQGRYNGQFQVKEVTARQRDIVTFQWQDGN